MRNALISIFSKSIADVSKFCVLGVLAATLGITGCAPGMTNRSLGEPRQPAPEVVVVEAQPEPSPAAEVRNQKREIAQLREELKANRARADAAVARADEAALEAQKAIGSFQTELAEVRARADAASAQSDKAFEIATEFLSNLVAAREEQRTLVERNLKSFDAMDKRLATIEGQVVETRKRRDADLAAALVLSSEMQLQQEKANEQLAQLREQLIQLNRDNEKMRAAIDSGAMLGMLRQLEAGRRDTAVLRGALEEMQREQEAGRKRLQNYYLDLDARIQALQQRERAARQAGANGIVDDDAALSESSSILNDQGDPVVTNAPEPFDSTDPSSGDFLEQDIEDEALSPLQIVPADMVPQNADGTTGAAQTPPLQDAPGDADALLEEAADLVDAARDRANSTGTPPSETSSLPDAVDRSPESGPGGASEDPLEHERIEVPGPESRDPDLMNDIQDAGNEGQQVPDRQPLTAHGLIITDWGVSASQPESRIPAESAQ